MVAPSKYMRLVREARELIHQGFTLSEIVSKLNLPPRKYTYSNGILYIRGGSLASLHVGKVKE